LADGGTGGRARDGRGATGATPARARRRAVARAPRSPGAVAASVVLHGALTLFLVQALRLPAPLAGLFTRAPIERPLERLTYVRPVDPGAPAPEPRVAPPAAQPLPAPAAVSRGAAPPRLVAPVVVPDGVAPATSATPAAPTREDDGRGVVGGAGAGSLTGAAAGLRPTYTPSVVWRRPLFDYETPTSLEERLDSAVHGDLAAVRDSLLRESLRRRPGDWTFQRNGRTYGMDERFIHLGPVSIPTALLGLLPLQQQANPSQLDRRALQMGAESREQGMRRAVEDNFEARVQSIRERRERERAERRARASSSTPPPGGR